jgi:hypothetical protein
MNGFKLLLLLVVAAVGYKYWNKHHAPPVISLAAQGQTSSTGFIELPSPSNASPGNVLVLAAENCPEEAAKRADALTEELRRNNIPVTRAHSTNFSFQNPDPDTMRRLDSVMRGDLPVVFINGKGKSNPTLDEVIAEYQNR